MSNLLPNVSTVDIGGFIASRIDARNGGNVNNRVIPAPFPRVKEADNPWPRPFNPIHVNRGYAHHFTQALNNTVIGIECPFPYDADGDYA